MSNKPDRGTTQKRRTLYLLIVCAVGVCIAISAIGATVSWTNTEAFCISCHEMENGPYQEFKSSAHDVNKSGIRATCSSCHVPKEWGPMIGAKIRASKDLFFHFTGKIDTPEKFNEHRLAMSEQVWRSMKQNDSRECRNCHEVSAMEFSEQQGRAARKHKQMAERGQTCIDCHKGVAHELPEEYENG